MFDTNDVFNEATRGASIHTEDNGDSEKSLLGSNVVAILLLAGIAYVGLNYYGATITTADKTLVVKNELIAEIQVESETLVESKLEVVAKVSNSEADYLSALREIESELTEERENVNLDTTEQMSLSSAMNNLMEDKVLADNTEYTQKLQKEIGIELNEIADSASIIADNEMIKDSRTVVVKKGDTLQGISNKFYGDAMKYKRIIASNDSLISNDTIYVGQTILLPY